MKRYTQPLVGSRWSGAMLRRCTVVFLCCTLLAETLQHMKKKKNNKKKKTVCSQNHSFSPSPVPQKAWELFVSLTVSMQSSENRVCRTDSVQREVGRKSACRCETGVPVPDMLCISSGSRRLRYELPQAVQGPGGVRVQEEHQADQCHRQSNAELHVCHHGHFRGWAWSRAMNTHTVLFLTQSQQIEPSYTSSHKPTLSPKLCRQQH